MTRAIVWFRRDCSLADNLAWAYATATHDEVLPVYVLDQPLISAAGPFRRRYFFASLNALADGVRERGGCLFVASGDPVENLARLAREHAVDEVVWNGDVTAYAQRRDHSVRTALEGAGVRVACEWSTLVHPPGSVLTNAGTVARVFSRFFERWADLPLARLATGGDARVLALGTEVEQLGTIGTADGAEHEIVDPETVLASFGGLVDGYHEERDRPDHDLTSHLSAHLRFGTISPRAVVRRIGAEGAGPHAFVRQLAWRDWYAHLFHERPDLVDHNQSPRFDAFPWADDPDGFAAWKAGRTGYPIVDAGMRELAATGWMHNRVRLIVASFLVKDLLIDWRRGERHFRCLLVDGDIPQNAGNWQWVAGTGPDAAPYFRIFNPVTQGRRFDPAGDYVRRWVPELGALAGADIHAPWELGPLELAAAGIELCGNYPEPIVDHGAARARALAVYASMKRSG